MPYASLFKEVVVVEEVRRFKPDPAVYRYLCNKAGKEGREEDVWLVSGNPFDVVGARSMGWKAVWVDRAGNGWVDNCVEGEAGRPNVIVRSLKEVLTAVSEHRGT
jgi:2-haloacid dehalogenase